MRYVKQLTAFTLMFTLLFSTIVWASPADVVGKEYEEAVNVLSALNILNGYEDGTFKPEDTITRAEFAAVIIRMLGLSGTKDAVNSNQLFNDVSPEHWGAGYVQITTQMGIIKGYGDGNFGPDAPVTYEQAIKMIVCALGYELYAEQKGGYPIGYLTVASDKQITRNVKAEAGSAVTRGAVAKLVYHALDVETLEQEVYGDQNTYTVTEDETLLTQRLNTKKIKGRVNGNAETLLAGSSTLKNDEIQIDSKTYKVGNTKAKSFIGYNVIAYVKTDKTSDESTVLYITADSKKNDILTVKADDILEETTVAKLVYQDEKGNKEEADISDAVDVIYNGKACTEYSVSDFKPKSGEITLMDNNGDNTYDIVIITSYTTYVIDSINASKNTVIDKYNQPVLNINDKEDNDLKYTILKNGSLEELMFLKEWNVLSVAKSKDEKSFSIKVSEDKITGKASEYNAVDNKVVVDGKEYGITDSFTEKIPIGEEGVFYLDIYGKVAAFDNQVVASSLNYAYLMNVNIPNSGMEKRAEFKMISVRDKGKLIYAKSAKNLKLDGAVIELENLMQALKDSADDTPKYIAGTVAQLIIYKQNEAQEITSIDTVTLNEAKGETKENTLTLDLKYSSDKITYKGSLFGGVIGCDNNTIVLSVPSDRQKEKDYSVSNRGSFKYDGTYSLEGYDLADNFVANLIILYDGGLATTLEDYYGLLVIDRVADAINVDGDEVKKIYGVYQGRKVELEARDETVFEDIVLHQGDIVIHSVDEQGRVTGLQKVYDITYPPAYYTPNPKGYVSHYVLSHGKVVSKIKNIITISPSDDMSAAAVAYEANRLAIYDQELGRVLPASVDDIVAFNDVKDSDKASTLFIYTRYGVPQDVVIIKWAKDN